MNLKEIIAIAGKPGLYRLLSQTRGAVVVESIEDKKRTAAPLTKGVSSLGEIAMYTETEEVPLNEIMRRIAEKEDGKEIKFIKADQKEYLEYFRQIVPNYDKGRVYPSHIAKLFKWYNELAKAGLVSKEKAEEQKTDEQKINEQNEK